MQDSLDQKIDSVYNSLDQKIDSVSNSLDQKIDDVNTSLSNSLNSFKEETRENFKLVFKYFDEIDNRLTSLESDVSDIKQEIKKDKKERNFLITRIDSIEKELKVLKARLT